MLKALPTCLILSIIAFSSAQAQKTWRGDVTVLPGGPTNSAYLLDMKERFYRNLPTSLVLPADISIRFFLTAKGSVRDVSIIKSSGNSAIDLTCVDAALCASPLPAPDILRTILKAPPDAFLYEPNEYGEGVYTFTFNQSVMSREVRGEEPDKTQHNSEIKTQGYELQLIPNEVLYRYPGLFTIDELASSNNHVLVKADPYFLECVRNPWSLRYTILDTPLKKDLFSLSKSIVDNYVNKKRVPALH